MALRLSDSSMRVSLPIVSALALAAASCAGPVRYAPQPAIALEPSSNAFAQDVSAKLEAHLALQGDFHANDVIRLSFPYYPLLGGDQRIQLNGQISPPMLPPMQAVGVSAADLQARLNQLYRAKLDKPDVSVQVVAYNRPPPLPEIFIMGEVAKPGNFPWREGTTIFEGLARAGGGSRDADLRRVVLLQPAGDHMFARMVDLEDVLRGSRQPVGFLSPFSIVIVPPTAIARDADKSRQIRQIIGFNGVTLGTAISLSQ
jgi:protein involved in polysaccharide export with SLBB domain